MDALPVDPSLAVSEAARSSLIQRKLDMDALRKRLGDTATKEEKLRESCEGFEAIFLQKMWEEMRKNVSKEGYLHSKDEEAYQSMFDVELCKKMTSAGGIGLADMLYEQLSQQLENTGRTTRPSSGRQFLPIPPAEGLLPAQQGQNTTEAPAGPATPAKPAAPASPLASADKTLTAADLYTPLEQEPPQPTLPHTGAETARSGQSGGAIILGALDELKAELGMAPNAGPGSTARDWAAARDAAPGLQSASSASLIASSSVNTAAPSAVQNAAAATDPALQTASATQAELASWKGPGPVSAKPKPDHLFWRDKNAALATLTETRSKPAVQPKGMAPSDTLWPLAGEQGTVTGHFGWEDDPATGKRRWNPGVHIAAPPDTPVRAVLPGTVVYAGQREGRGHTVVLEHKDGYRSYYSNVEPNSVKIGEHVRHGAEFAKIAAQPSLVVNGENSASLLFELKKGEMALNPESAISRTVNG